MKKTIFYFIFFSFVLTGVGQVNFQWAKSMGGTLIDYGYDIKRDGSGNIILAGTFEGTADFDPGAGIFNLTSYGAKDVFFAKFDPSGNLIWAKSFGGSGFDDGTAINLDASGNIYITGYFQNTVDFDPGPGIFNMTSAGITDVFVSKLDASGNFTWAKRIGGTSYDESYSSKVDALGNVYTTGLYRGTVDFDPGTGVFYLISAGYDDVFISKLDASGNFVWAKRMGGNNYDEGSDITLDISGNVYTTGRFMGTADFDPGTGIYNLVSAGETDIFISKLDASGSFLWAKRIGGISYDQSKAIVVDASENVFTTGWYDGTVDFDPGTGNYYMTSAGGYDIFISKLDINGNFVFAKSMGGSGTDIGHSIKIDNYGNIYSTGQYYGTADFDPGTGTFNMVSAGVYDIFILKLNVFGNFIWALSMGGTTNDMGHFITLDNSGNLFTTGYFWGTADFDPGTGTFNMVSAGSYDIFLLKLKENNVEIGESFVNQLIFVFPNPFSDSFVLESKVDCELFITDISGREIIHKTIIAGKNEIKLNNNQAGVYIVKLKLKDNGYLVKAILKIAK